MRKEQCQFTVNNIKNTLNIFEINEKGYIKEKPLLKKNKLKTSKYK